MTGFRLTPQAREGLARIVLYTELRFGAVVADRVLGALVEAITTLADHPALGHRRSDLTAEDGVRFWSVGPTLIAYREGAEGIEVLFVERGEVDWELRFSDGS